MRPTLLGGLSALIAALTAVATVNGAVARMFRNDPSHTAAAVILVLVGFLCGLLSQISQPAAGQATVRVHKAILAVGSVTMVLGIAFALVAQVATMSLGERPIIAARTQSLGSSVDFHAEISTQGAKAHDQVVITIFGLKSDNSRTSPIYYAKFGPDQEGNFHHEVQMDLDIAKTAGLYLTAVVVPEGILPVLVDCDGNVVEQSGERRLLNGETVPFHTHGFPLVSCLVLSFS